MADLPILFSGSMVRAILREIEQPGTGKTQTRRVLNPQPFVDGYYEGEVDCTFVPSPASNLSAYFRFAASAVDGGAIRTETYDPRYAVGDRLYVRETWAPLDALTHSDPGTQALADRGFYRADDSTVEGEISRWRPGIHMPRWASRITLIVTDVRVQRLQEISEGDAIAEGVEPLHGGWFPYGITTFMTTFVNGHEVPAQYCPTACGSFCMLWDSLNADRGYGWEANPWVAAYTFKPILGNVDQIAEAA